MHQRGRQQQPSGKKNKQTLVYARDRNQSKSRILYNEFQYKKTKDDYELEDRSHEKYKIADNMIAYILAPFFYKHTLTFLTQTSCLYLTS